MTTQFSQLVSYTFLLRMAPDNSYFILCPRTVSVQSNKSLTFGGYGSFSEFDSIVPHYSPSYPVNFQQFGASWCEESIRAYFNHLNISSYLNRIQYEGIRFAENGNRSSASGISSSILLCNLLINNQIDTDFDNLFSNLISSLNTLLTPIAQISSYLLGINNLFPTLVHNLEVLNENNVPVSIAQILKDKQIDVDMSGTQVSLDDTNLVTQLQNIYTILSSQNANQSAISSSIQNKDNQTNIVNILEEIFIDKISSSNRQSTLKRNSNSNNNNYLTIYSILLRIFQSLSTFNALPYENYTPNSRLLANLVCLSHSPSNNISDFRSNSFLNLINTSISNIETKLEQNLPFVTNVYPLVETNVDFPYEVKILNKDNCSDNRKNDI